MYNFNLMKISFIRENRKIVKLAKKLLSESSKNNTQRENLKKERKFPFEKEEESAKEKYKDYFIKNIKEEEALRRSVDQEFYDQLKKNSLSPTKFASLLRKRNFLKFKEENFKQDEVKEINLKDLDDLKIEIPITLYEIDLSSVTQYKKLDSLIKNYSILFVLFN